MANAGSSKEGYSIVATSPLVSLATQLAIVATSVSVSHKLCSKLLHSPLLLAWKGGIRRVVTLSSIIPAVAFAIS